MTHDIDRQLITTRETADYWSVSRDELLALLTAFWLDEPRYMAIAQGWHWPRRKKSDWCWAVAIPATLLASLVLAAPSVIADSMALIKAMAALPR